MSLPRRMARAAVPAAAAAVTVAVAAGCVGVPSSSPARIADRLPANARPPERLTQHFVVVKPERGDSPRDIVYKFYKAQANPERSHGVARRFLTPQAQDSWDDTASVQVIEALPYVRPASPDNRVTVTAERVGTVASNGSYTPGRGPYRQSLHLVRVDGQWRIDSPPSGVTVALADFHTVYRQYLLYYLDQTEKHVVGDPRYFPTTSTSSPSSMATLFLRLLHQAPSAALADAVRSELMGSVQLVGNVVQGNDKVLRVYLTGLGVRTASVRSAAVAQIVWTLSQLVSTGVEIFDDGQRLDLRGVTQPTQQSDWQSFDPDTLPVNTTAYYLSGGALYTADGARVPGPAGRGDYDLSSVAVSLTDGPDAAPRVAGVSAAAGQARLYVGTLGQPLTLRLRARTITSLTFDDIFDEVWAIRDGRVVRVPRRGAPVQVDTQSLDDLGPLHLVRLSRDGSRVAIVAGDPGRLYVARVGRDNGQVAVEGPVNVAPTLVVTDVSWESATTLMVLASGPGNDRMLRTLSVDGAVSRAETTAGLPGPPVRVATAPNLPAVVESDGSLWQRSGDRWTNLVPGRTVAGSNPVYPD